MVYVIFNSLNCSPFPRQIPVFSSSSKNWLEKNEAVADLWSEKPI